MMREDGGITLIDNAHTVLTPHNNYRHTTNSLFLPGCNFHARNLLGFPFLHCCTLPSTCPRNPKPRTCPGSHTLYWPSLVLDYRCHVPRGRIGHLGIPPRTRACLARLAHTPIANLSEELRVSHRSVRLRRLVDNARRIHELGFEEALRDTRLSPGYYKEGVLHNGIGRTEPCCSLTLDGPTSNRMDDEWRCHIPYAHVAQ